MEKINLYNYLPSRKLVWKYVLGTIYLFPPSSTKLYTCIDCRTSYDAIHLLKVCSREDTSLDDIMDKLLRIYKQFLPNEISLQSLSIESQRYEKQGGREEFAVCTVFMAMNMAISETNIQNIQKNKCRKRMSF